MSVLGADRQTEAEAEAAAGVIAGRRPGRPTARAAVGGLLVAAAAVVVFAVALSAAGGRGSTYVVASGPLAAGTVIGPGEVGTERISLPSGVAAAAYRSTATVIGRTLAVAVQPGQLIESTMLDPAGHPAIRPVSIPVDPDSLAGLAPGSLVDVLAVPSSSGAAGSPASLVVVARNATLLAESRPASGLLPQNSTGVVVTLGVTDLAEAEAVVAAAHAGTVELIQAEPGDGSGAGSG